MVVSDGRRSRSQTQNRVRVRREKVATDGSDRLGIDAVDLAEQLIEWLVRLVVQLHPRGAVHPRRRAFERERDLSLQLAFPGDQLGVGYTLFGQQAQLRPDR